nr:hypothetical protein [Acidiferrobacter sp. SPIII_3]
MSAALGVFLALFVLVTGLGFWASRWRPGDLNLLSEWGLGGRRFGSFVTWFLLGGDLYTAYTFIAVPALVFGQGALGFFALPYTIVMYPVMFMIMPRLWTIARDRGYVTAADFVEHKFDCRMLGLLVAITGILATMPYIALQLVGLQVVLAALHIGGSGTWADAPLVIAFVILAAYTYTGGLRAPALIRGPARPGAYRHRKGPLDLHDRADRDHRDSGPPRRVGGHFWAYPGRQADLPGAPAA